MDITPGGEATAQIKDDDDSGVARLNFRVRCETIGYGESIFLYREDSKARVSVLFQKKKKKKIMVALEAHLPKKKKKNDGSLDHRKNYFHFEKRNNSSCHSMAEYRMKSNGRIYCIGI